MGKIVILHAYRPFLTFLTMYKSEKFQNINNRRVLIGNICRALGVTLLIIFYLCLFLSSELLVFIKSDFDLNVGGVEFSYFVGGVPSLAVHLLLIWKCDNITDALDYLHGIVIKRKFLC